MKLISDFTDYYDSEFTGYGPIVKRNMNNGRTRLNYLKLLSLYFLTPTFGKVKEVIAKFKANQEEEFNILNSITPLEVIVYHNEYAHAGEGKEKLTFDEALRLYPNKLCTIFVPCLDRFYNVTLRWLVIGKYNVFLKYSTPVVLHEWQSNYKPKVEILKDIQATQLYVDIRDEEPLANYRMFAVDFVPCIKGLAAIDFNTSPGLEPVKELYSSKDIIKMLEEYQPANIFGS